MHRLTPCCDEKRQTGLTESYMTVGPTAVDDLTNDEYNRSPTQFAHKSLVRLRRHVHAPG